MGDRIPKTIIDGLPPMTFGASAGAYIARYVSVISQGSAVQFKPWSTFSIICIVVAVLSLVAWWRRGLAKDKEDALWREKTDLGLRKIDDLHEVRFPAPSPGEVAARGLDAARGVGNSIRVSPGNTFTMAIGAGPVTVTVPSGGMFGAGSPEFIEFTLDDQQHSLSLPRGGTVTIVPAQLSGKVESVSEVKGQPTTPTKTEDEPK